MMKSKVLGLLLLFVSLLALSGCEDDRFDRDWDDATSALCRYHWVDEYISTQGYRCTQELVFYPDGTGMDFTTTFFPNYADERKQAFHWDWDLDQGYFTSFYLDYYDGTDYFDDVYINNGALKALLNGEPVVFYAM